MTNPPKQPKKKRGRPPKFGKRRNFNFRLSEEARRSLVQSADKEGRSLSEELEFRVNRDLRWEAAEGDIDQMKARAAAWESTAMINAIRAAGLAILREIDAKPVRVIVDLETLLAEANGVVRGLRSGFIDDKTPSSDSGIRQRTAEETRLLIEKEKQLLDELAQTRRELEQAIERTLAADAAAAEKAKKRSA